MKSGVEDGGGNLREGRKEGKWGKGDESHAFEFCQLESFVFCVWIC